MAMKSVWPTPAKDWMTMAVGVIAVPMMGLGIGTGGAATLDYVRARGNKGYPYAHYEARLKAFDVIEPHRPAEDIARIRSILGCTVTDMAGLLGVSRQAI